MKTRSGFVSNSSSSSFVCDVCGCEESGRDCSLSDFDMFRCTKGHTICNCHKLPVTPEQKALWIKEKEENEDSFYDEHGYDDCEGEYSPIRCPICMMKSFNNGQIQRFMMKHFKTTKEEIVKVIVAQFKTYEEFMKYLTEKE